MLDQTVGIGVPPRVHCKIAIIIPGFVFVQSAFFGGLIFGGAYFQRGLLLEGILHFKTVWTSQ